MSGANYQDCISAEDINNYIRNFQDTVAIGRQGDLEESLPKFDESKRNSYLRRRLGLSLKSDSQNEKVFVFKSDEIDGVESNVRMGDSILAVDGTRCKSLSQMLSLIGYGENRKVELLLDRDSKIVEGYIKFD